MAGVITNIIKTLFTTSGADTVQADIARLTRGQTRLGQSSVGAGRQFAAQASGLGGLVAAYAGAAATSFALTAAFDALSRSARSMQTIQGVDTLAAGVAQSGSSLLKSVQEITKGQLTLTAAAEQTSLALSAGFNTSQIENLSVVALKASRALGRDLADSMTRVVRGSAKMETELLDELGIYTKIEPATRAYAAAIGKNVSALSEFERRQAFVNAVIAEGQRKFSAINTTIPTSAEQIEALGSRLSDLATQLGGAIADIVAPLAAGIVDNVAASFGALGLVLSLVASKGVSLFTSSMTALVASMEKSLLTNENRKRAWLGLTAVVLKATDANKALADSMLRLNAADQASLATIRTAAGTRALSNREIKDSNKLLKTNEQLLKAEKTQLIQNGRQRSADYKASLVAVRDTAAAAKEAANRVTAAKAVPAPGGINTTQAREKAQAVRAAMSEQRAADQAAKAAKDTQVALRNSLQPAVTANTAAFIANNAAINANTAAINANVAATTGWRAKVAGATAAVAAPVIKSIGNLGTVFGSVLGIASKLFFIVTIFQLIGTAIANALGYGDEFNAFFSELGKSVSSFISGQKTKALKSTMLSIAGGALADIEAVDAQIRGVEGFTFRKKSIIGVEIEITKTKEQLIKEVSNILADVGTESGKSFGKSVTSSLALSLGGLGLAIGSFFTPIGAVIGGAVGLALGTGYEYFFGSDEATAAVEEYGDEISKKFAEKLAELPAAAKEAAVKGLSIIQERYGAKALIDPAARAAKTLQEDVIFRSVKYLEVTAAIGQTMAATAKSADELVKSFDFKKVIDGPKYLQQAITAIGDTKVTFTFIDDMDEQLRKLLDISVFAARDLEKALNMSEIKVNNIVPPEQEISDAMDKVLKEINRGLTMGVDIDTILSTLMTGELNTDPITFAILKQLTQLDNLESYLTSVESSYNSVGGAVNQAQQGLLMTTAVLRSTNDELARGTLTLERYGQNTSNVGDALIKVAKDLEEAKSKLPAMLAALAVISTSGTADQIKAAYDLYNAEELRIANLEAILAMSRAELDVQLSKGDAIREQVALTDFLKDQGKGVMSDIAFNFELAKAGAENATTASANYFATLLKGNKDNSKAAAAYQVQLSAAFKLPANKNIVDSLSKAQKQALRSASQENLALTAITLNGIADIAVDAEAKTISINGKVLDVVTQVSQDALTTVSLSADAMKKLAQDTYLEAVNLAKKFGDTIAQTISDVAEQLKTIEAEKTTAKIQFEIDSLNLDMEAAKAAREFNIAFLENQIKMTELNVDLKKTKPVAGAEQINTFEADILKQRRALIEDERRISADIYDKELKAIVDKGTVEKDRIDLEINARTNAIIQEYDLLKNTIITYNNISAQLEDAIVTSGNTMGETIVRAMNLSIEAFVGSFGKFGEALGLVAKEAKFTDTPKRSVELEALPNGGVISAKEKREGKLLGDLGTLEAAGNAALDSLTALGKAQQEAVSASVVSELDLLDKRYAAEKLDLNRRVALLAQEEGISKLEAEKRLKAAEEAGDAAKKLTGRLEDLKSAIDSSVNSALMGINDAIINGTEENKNALEVLRDAIGSIFISIQEEVYKQTIANPLSDMISSWLVGGIKQLNIKDIRGSSLAGVLGSARGATGEKALAKNIMGDNAVDAGAEAFKKAGEKIKNGISSLGTGVNAAAGAGASAVSNAAGVLATTTTTSTGVVATANTAGASTLMSSLGPILAVLAVIAAIMALFGGKKGGASKSSVAAEERAKALAQSNTNTFGAIPRMTSGNMVRDRVPAMLEPGEFVIRKPMVKRIGASNLAQMNATGNSAGNSAPTINIKNEGSPKTAEASPPRFDGEKYVIDVIMRDLSTNGPIRRSLRGGAL